MWIFDGIKIEEAGMRNALGKEGIVAIAAVVGEEPGCAKRNDARFGGELTGVVL
jgi:hypothetical protein